MSTTDKTCNCADACAIAELVRVCGEKGWNWELGSDTRGASLSAGVEPIERLFYCKLLDDVFNEMLREEGDTVALAATRALTEALRK